jgi:hypothetical protein
MIVNPDRLPKEVDETITVKYQDKIKIEGIGLMIYVVYAFAIIPKM